MTTSPDGVNSDVHQQIAAAYKPHGEDE